MVGATHNESLQAERAAFPVFAAPSAPASNETTPVLLLENRLQRVGRALWLDGRPFMLRGVCYSPVPTGQDPGYGEPYGDYFTSQYEGIFKRVAKGVDAVRVVALKVPKGVARRHPPR